MASPWPLPKFDVSPTDFKVQWSAIDSDENFPTLSIGQKQPRGGSQFAPEFPPTPMDAGLSLTYPSVYFVLSATTWDTSIGPRYERKGGNDRLSCLAQRAVKLYIRRVSCLLKEDSSRVGDVMAMQSFDDIIVQISRGQTKMVLSAMMVLRQFLGDNPNHVELQHFYRMVEESDDWESMDLHPFLQHTEGRLLLPVCCMLLLEEAYYLKKCEAAKTEVLETASDGVKFQSDEFGWDETFNEWFKINYSSYPIKVRFSNWSLGGHVDLFRNCWNDQKQREQIACSDPAQPGDKTKSAAQLVRFARALPIHLNNYLEYKQKLSEAEIEHEYSKKFFYINLALFEFMLKERGAQLSLLRNPRTHCQFGLLKKKKPPLSLSFGFF